jgi:IrrE N-terminal-like domain
MFGPGSNNGYWVTPRSTALIREHVKRVRPVLVQRNSSFFPMGQFIERLAALEITVDVVENNDLPAGVEACCIPERLLMQLRLSTYEGACRDDPRARFTVIHELGHILLQHSRAFNRSNANDIRPFEDSEWQANQFAAEFLMPFDDIVNRRLTTPSELQLTYHVSAAAAETRITKLMQKGELKKDKPQSVTSTLGF